MLIRINDDIINLALVTLTRKREHSSTVSIVEFTYPDSTVTEYYFSNQDAKNIWGVISATKCTLTFDIKEL